MAKCIKRAGIIFFATFVSLLIIVCSVCVTNVAESDNSRIVNTNENTNIIQENGTEFENNVESNIVDDKYVVSNNVTYDIPQSEFEFDLGHKLSCTNQTTCYCMQDIWNEAIQKSLDTGKRVKVTLQNDWIARKLPDTDADIEYITSFGKGVGFQFGYILVPRNVQITLDLNGKTIDRNLTNENPVAGGRPIMVYGTLDLYDSSYNQEEAYKIYNTNSTNETNLKNAYSNFKCGKITGGSVGSGSYGSAIALDGATLNMYGGMLTGNFAANIGGAIGSNLSVINFYDGIIFDNTAKGAAAINANNSNLYIGGGIMAFNESTAPGSNDNALYSQGGAVYFNNINGKVKIDGGVFCYNKAGGRGGFMQVNAAAGVDFENAVVSYNSAQVHGGGMYILSATIFNMKSGKVVYNTCGADGGGILVNTGTKSNISGGEISYNVATRNAGGIVIYDTVSFNGSAIISHNKASAGGGIASLGSLVTTVAFEVNGGVQIIDNTLLDGKTVSNVHLNAGQKILIKKSFIDSRAIVRMGITYGPNYGEEAPFTIGYGVNNANSEIATKRYFSSDIAGKSVKLRDGEVCLVADTTEYSELTWSWTGGSTKDTSAIVKYTGNPYVITCSAGNFNMRTSVSTADQGTSFEVTDAVSSYIFYVDGNYTNPVFQFTILPKEVDIVWDNTPLTYNGAVKMPTAHINEDPTCVVTVDNGQINVGNYVAMATSLSNTNYMINPKTKYNNFNIVPANLTIDITTKNAEKYYTGNAVDLGNDWYDMSATLLGQDNKKSLNSVFNIDYSKFIPMFTKDGMTTESAINVGKYDICLKNLDANSVFTGNNNYNVVINYVNGGTLTISMAEVIRASAESGYSYLLLDDNKRISYETKALIHGENDSNVNIKDGKATYVLGNINPNTAVNTFVNNLVFDTTKIQIYDSNKTLIYDKGVAASGISEELLNNRFELAVGTGWYIEYNVDGEKETIYLSVLGDINGDGRISASDVTYLRELANNDIMYDNLDVEFKLAGLIINKGRITSADSEIIVNVIAQIITIDLFY